MKTILLTLLPMLLLAQPPSRQSRFLDYEPDADNTVLKLRETLFTDGTIIFAEPALKLIALYADSTERLDRAEQLIRKYYKPKPVVAPSNRNVELFFYIIHARTGKEPGETLAALNPVLAQLRQVTPYQSFDLLDTLILRSGDGRKFNSAGFMPWKNTQPLLPNTYSLGGEVRLENSLIYLPDLKMGGRFSVRTSETTSQYAEFAINSSISFKPGQFAVVGKTNVTATDGAMVLVVTARVVD